MPLLKPFAAWATALWDKYTFDIYFRTKWNVIALQVGFTVFMLVLFWMSLQHAHEELVRTIVSNLSLALEHPTGGLAEQIPSLVRQEKIEGMAFLFTGLLLLTTLFGYIVAYATLRPTRMALEMQKKFIGNIAHELRTPLAILKTNTEVALLTEKMHDSLSQTLHENIEELDRTSNIINNLLSFNALFRPERMEFEDVAMREIIERTVQVLSDLAKSREVTLLVEESASPKVWGNAAALEQLVTNLVKNAIIYSGKKDNLSPVTISVAPAREGFVEFSVTDQGIGIPRSELSRIFEPFYRVDSSRKREAGSSGLGLAIVQEIVKYHRGQITIQSTPGKGTRVSVLIPASTEEAPLP